LISCFETGDFFPVQAIVKTNIEMLLPIRPQGRKFQTPANGAVVDVWRIRWTIKRRSICHLQPFR
jgi:hypothetical protein